MNTEQLTRIMTGSCTPATDLLKAVETKQISYLDAQDFYNDWRSGKARANLHSASSAEMAYMKHNDI